MEQGRNDRIEVRWSMFASLSYFWGRLHVFILRQVSSVYSAHWIFLSFLFYKIDLKFSLHKQTYFLVFPICFLVYRTGNSFAESTNTPFLTLNLTVWNVSLFTALYFKTFYEVLVNSSISPIGKFRYIYTLNNQIEHFYIAYRHYSWNYRSCISKPFRFLINDVN